MSTVFPYDENARDCTDKGGACRAGSAWLNYYIKSIRRLGRGLDIAADLGEKSGMTGSCERDACGSARLKADAVRPFAARRPGWMESYPTRQGISSTDKDVIDSSVAAVSAGGFSSSVGRAHNRVHFAAGKDPGWTRVATLVDGRCNQGLDSSAVSVKLPVKQQIMRRSSGRIWHAISGDAPERTVRRPIRTVSRRRSCDCRSHQGGPFPVRRQSEWMEGMDPASLRRTLMGIRRERPAL